MKLALLVLGLLRSCTSLTLMTRKTRLYVKQYTRSMSESVVEAGGWYAVERKAVRALAEKEFAKLEPHLAGDLNMDRELLIDLAADPKGALLDIIKGLLASQSGETNARFVDADNLDLIVALLQAQGKGFNADTVDGEWILALQRQGDKSPKAQKLVGRGEKIGKSYSNFDVKGLEFTGDIRLLKGLAKVSSTVAYKPVATSYDVVNGKSIVLRRIQCDIIKAGLKFRFLPRLPLSFLRRKGGFLDFAYLDDDLRITRGSRGGLFVHARPSILQDLQAS